MFFGSVKKLEGDIANGGPPGRIPNIPGVHSTISLPFARALHPGAYQS